MKLISWNVNGIRSVLNKGFLHYFDQEKPDIFCLQETKAHPEQLDPQLLCWGGMQSYWSYAHWPGYSGTVTYSSESPKKVSYGIQRRQFDFEGRFVITEHPHFLLYNVYFPNGGMNAERHLFKQNFLKKFWWHLKSKKEEGKEIIVVGDYNIAYRDEDVFDPIRLSQVSGFLPEEREWFRHFLSLGFVDTFAYFHPEAKSKYTWWSYRENARVADRGWRIDHICLTPRLLDRVSDVEIQNQQYGSDHCPVKIQLEV